MSSPAHTMSSEVIRIRLKLKKEKNRKGVRKRANSEWRRHDEFAAVSHQRARFNKALKPGAKPTKAKDVGKAKRKRSCVLVKSFRIQKQ